MSLKSEVVREKVVVDRKSLPAPYTGVSIQNNVPLLGEILPPLDSVRLDRVLAKAFNDVALTDPMMMMSVWDNGTCDEAAARSIREALSLEGYVIVNKAL